MIMLKSTEERLEKAREYYQRNKEKIKERRRERYWSDPEGERKKQRVYSKTAYYKDPAASKARTVEWMRKNKDLVNARERLRRYRKKGDVGKIKETELLIETLTKNKSELKYNNSIK